MLSADYDSIARLVTELRKINCIENAFIASIGEKKNDETGEILYEYTVTCTYILPEYEATTEAPAADTSATEAPAADATDAE